jgi:hypothetical protein
MYIAETDAVAVVIVFEPNSCRGVLDTTLCDKVCKGLATGWRGYFWREGGTPGSSTNRSDDHNITETLLKVALNTITLTLTLTLLSIVWFLLDLQLLIVPISYPIHLHVSV